MYNSHEMLEFAKFVSGLSLSPETIDSVTLEVWEQHSLDKDREFETREENWYGADNLLDLDWVTSADLEDLD